MYTSYIGKKFLKYYNEKEGTNYSAREFFDEIMFPLFYDHPIFLMWVHNSPFDQLNKENAKKKKEHKKQDSKQNFISLMELTEERNKKKNELLKKIENLEVSGSTAVGYSVADLKGVSSGQITNMKIPITSDDLICSWLGQALAIGVKGGHKSGAKGGYLLIDKEELLYKIFLGWKVYRKFIVSIPNIKGNQIETWNSHWIIHICDRSFNSDGLNLPPKIETENKNGIISIPTILWTRVIFLLAKLYPNQDLNVYSYILSKTNTSLGFIKVYLPQIRRLYEFRDAIFINKNKSILTDKQIELLEPFYDFKSVCKQSTIGINSVEPDKLRDYLPKGSYIDSKGEEIKINKKNYTTYLIYKLWVIAMLNKTELLQLAEKVAAVLIDREKEDSTKSRGKMTRSRETQKLLESHNIKFFIENITTLLEKQNENADMFKEVVTEVLKMPVDNFPLFVVLIKFEYIYQKSLGEK